MRVNLELPEWRDEENVEQTAVYIAGPMRGVPSFGFPMFDRARDWLRKRGYFVFSPADNDRRAHPGIEGWPGFAEGRLLPGNGFDIHAAMAWDLSTVTKVDAIVLLPGWEGSTGARQELAVAEACGKRVYLFEPGSLFDTMRERPRLVLLGLAGYARAGKDTAGKVLVNRHGFVRVAFADALKQLALERDPLIRVHDTASLTPRGGDWRCSELYLTHAVATCGWEWVKENTEAREFLQALGVAVRHYVDPDAWVNALLRQTTAGGRYVITDVRFPNEYEAIKRAGGQVWRIARPGTYPANDHISETALDIYKFDRTIQNIGTLEEFQRRVFDLSRRVV